MLGRLNFPSVGVVATAADPERARGSRCGQEAAPLLPERLGNILGVLAVPEHPSLSRGWMDLWSRSMRRPPVPVSAGGGSLSRSCRRWLGDNLSKVLPPGAWCGENHVTKNYFTTVLL